MQARVAWMVGACLHVGGVLSAAASGSPVGDWTGWVYQDGGGDFPVRLHVARSGVPPRAEWSASYDLPHAGSERVPLTVEEHDGAFVLRATSSPKLEFTADLAGGEATGRVSIDGAPLGALDLTRSALPLPSVDPASYAELVGSYRFESGRVVVVDRRFWGELMAFETESGRHATLFPLDGRRFFTGPAVYVADPVTALVTFFGDRILWHEPGREPEVGARIPIERTDLAFESEGAVLRGTLFHPAGAAEGGGLATVVVLGGSSWFVRADVERDALIWASAGFGAFVHDKRGNGESGGDPTVPFRTTAADARAAAGVLAERPEVDASRIGVTGASRGGWTAPLAAAGESPFAFCITFVGPAVSPARQETTRRLNEMRRAGFGEEEVARAAAWLEAAWRFAADGDAERYRPAYEAAADEPWAELAGVESPDADWEWARLNMHFDPVPVFEELRVPLLAVYGEKDSNVVPEENVPLLEAALERAGHGDHRIVVLPGVNHGLRQVEGDAQRSWSHRARGFAPGMWTLVTDWVRAH